VFFSEHSVVVHIIMAVDFMLGQEFQTFKKAETVQGCGSI